MQRAFVIRPFGKKADASGTAIDFEQIHDRLIAPALKDAGLGGGTTGEIIDAGNVREDMFSLIIEADLVVCDITVHNANVFYELGIRHALRKRRTVLYQIAFDDGVVTQRFAQRIHFDIGHHRRCGFDRILRRDISAGSRLILADVGLLCRRSFLHGAPFGLPIHVADHDQDGHRQHAKSDKILFHRSVFKYGGWLRQPPVKSLP